jgi:cysteinyl-tRNA synthetase
MVAMIGDLISKGHAYVAEGHVLFAVESYAGYGALSGRTVDDMIAGARVEVAPYKRNPMDFVLWKPSSPDQPGWDSPWGRGRPGWHIECSAMSYELLGESFDIHGGGNDLMFPHHENEIAQSCCAHPEGDFARVWMHNEMLQVEGKKMSKSLGNFFTVRDLLDQGVPGEVIRFVMLSTHYRSPMDWTAEKAKLAEQTLAKWFMIAEAEQPNSYGLHSVVPFVANDLNTPEAISRLHMLANAGHGAELKAGLDFLGLEPTGDWWRKQSADAAEGGLSVGVSWRGSIPSGQIDNVRKIAFKWANARKAKNYDEADALRKAAQDAGIDLRALPQRDAHAEIKDNFDPAKLEALQ